MLAFTLLHRCGVVVFLTLATAQVVKVSRNAPERRSSVPEFVLLAFRGGAPKQAKLNGKARSRALKPLQHVSCTI